MPVIPALGGTGRRIEFKIILNYTVGVLKKAKGKNKISRRRDPRLQC